MGQIAPSNQILQSELMYMYSTFPSKLTAIKMILDTPKSQFINNNEISCFPNLSIQYAQLSNPHHQCPLRVLARDQCKLPVLDRAVCSPCPCTVLE